MKRIRNQADLDDELGNLLHRHPDLAVIAETAVPLPLRLPEPGFEALVRIIIGQQVSTASATTIYDRFVKLINPATPQAFVAAGEPAWIEIGLSRAKQSTINGLATALIKGALDLETVGSLPLEESIRDLTSLKGIGPWTAEVYLLFCSGHRDIFPSGDVALREALRLVDGLDERPNAAQAGRIAARWKPHRGIAARLLWAYYKCVREGRETIPV